jgi:hypothetical protein
MELETMLPLNEIFVNSLHNRIIIRGIWMFLKKQ